MIGRRDLLALAIGAALGGGAANLHAAPAPAPASDGIQSQLDRGQRIFATSCSNCHGAGGKGAIGPPLIDRNLSFAALSTTILNGRVGTPMPPFKDGLDSKSLAAVMAYVQSITTGGKLPTEVVADPSQSGSSLSHPASQPVAVGRETGIPAHGAALFFDPTQMEACRTCHSFGDKGGPIGPDMALKPKTAEQIYQSISRAKVMSADYPAIILRVKEHPDVVGIKVEETSSDFAIFEVTSIPPIRRTVPKSQVSQAIPVSGTGIFDHTKLPFSKQDRLDLAAYLGSSEPQSPAK
jgi:mono/diheme cytochrome c family protein